MNNYEVSLELRISGTYYDASDIDKILGISSTRKYSIGDRKNPKNDLILYDENCWFYMRIHKEEIDPNAALELLVADLYGLEQSINKISEFMCVRAFFGIYEKNYMPGIIFDPHTLAFLVAANMKLDIDIICK